MPDCKKEVKEQIRGWTPEEIEELLKTIGEKPFRGQQIFRWLQRQAVSSWAEMTNLSKELQSQLATHFSLTPLKLIEEQISSDGTRKYLWELAEGSRIESVLLFHQKAAAKKRVTLCLSTQVGCPLACLFCATAQTGFVRNLSTAEIVSQVLDLTAKLRQTEPTFKIDNLVYMGMGEPLLNLPAVLKSIQLLNHALGQNIGMRHITISTCGLVPQIKKLAQEKLELVLAVSLHAPNNKLRNQIMPVNRQYPLEELMKALHYYVAETGRRITFEYLLIKDFNDGLKEATELAQLLSKFKANLNLIPLNEIAGSTLRKPTKKTTVNFVTFLRKKGIEVAVRATKGDDIDGACGQLRGKMD